MDHSAHRQPSRRWHLVLPLSAVLGLGVLVALMGVVSPASAADGEEDLCARVLQGQARLRLAVDDFVRDTQALPAPSFDLSEGAPSSLTDVRLVPLAQQAGWSGPYLGAGLERPTPSGFWSLADANTAGCVALAASGSAASVAPAAAWGRLHRGYGEIDDATARAVDAALDDGAPDRGSVQVTDTWIWFRLAELPAAPASP